MSVCPRCNAPFQCGVADGGNSEPCWCMALPPLPQGNRAAAGMLDRCLCPQCLQQLLASCGSDHSAPESDCQVR